MPPKESTTVGAVLTPLDTNQGEDALLQEAWSQKRKVVSLTSQDEALDREIQNLETICHQVETRKVKMLWLSELQKKIDEATEQMTNIAQNIEQTENQYRNALAIFIQTTPATNVRWPFRPKIILDELWSHNIFLWG
jgi:Fe2+ transport system protein B